MEVQNYDECIYNDENGHYVWYNNFKEAFKHLAISNVDNENRKVK